MEPETTVKDFCSSLKLLSLYIGYVLSIDNVSGTIRK